MFDWIFGWYWRGVEMAAFIYRVHSGMACLLAAFCDPRETEAFIERCRRRDEIGNWVKGALTAFAPVVCTGITGVVWLHLFGWGGAAISGWGLVAEFAGLTIWTVCGHPFLMLNVDLWRASAMGRDTALLLRRVQPYRVAQAAENVQRYVTRGDCA